MWATRLSGLRLGTMRPRFASCRAEGPIRGVLGNLPYRFSGVLPIVRSMRTNNGLQQRSIDYLCRHSEGVRPDGTPHHRATQEIAACNKALTCRQAVVLKNRHYPLKPNRSECSHLFTRVALTLLTAGRWWQKILAFSQAPNG